MPRLNRSRTTIVAVIALGTATGGYAYATGSSGGSAAELRYAVAEAPATEPISTVDPAIEQHFVLFREQAADGMPEEAAEQVGSSRRFGRNADLARAIRTTNGTGWVIPANGFLCIAVPDPVDGFATGCSPTAAAIQNGLILSMGGSMPNDKVSETLVVPDGRRAVDGQGNGIPTDRGVVSMFVDRAGTLRVAD